MNRALFLCLLATPVGVGVTLKSITDTSDNVIDVHRVDANILDNSYLNLYRI